MDAGGNYSGGKRRAGFSLVEVVSSLGIVSFGLVALLGLLPVGIQVSRDSRESTAEAQITQYLSNFVHQSSSSQLTDLIEPHAFYFDRQGLSLPEDSADIFYRVTLSQESEQGATLLADSSLATLQIHVQKVNQPNAPRTIALHRVLLDR